MKTTIKTIIALASLALAGYLAYSAYTVWLAPDNKLQQIYLVPPDAAIIIQASDPIGDWERFTKSSPWQALSRAESMAEIAQTMASLERTLEENSNVLGLVGKRDVVVSLHKTRPREWDFLAIADLQKISKMRLLKNQIESIIELAGMEATRREYKNIDIIEMRDPETRKILYMAFVDNHIVASYSNNLVTAAIDERENPTIGLDHAFLAAEKMVGGRGICRVFLNYVRLPEFMNIYMPSPGGWFDGFVRSMDFAGLSFDATDDGIEVSGGTIMGENPDPYVATLLASGRREMSAHEIMPARTAFYADICFDDPVRFVAELEKTLAEGGVEAYESYNKTRKQLEKYFDISLTEDFLGWMEGEFAFAELEPGLLGREGEFILAIRAKDIALAREKMALIERRVRGRTPLRIASVDYNGYPINYVELKGFFRLFFGAMFSRFETPFYTYVDDYVVMSNLSSSLLSFVEDHRQKNRMADKDIFTEAFSKAERNSTVFAFMDTRRFWPLVKPMVGAATWEDLAKNQDVVRSFPAAMLQITAGRETSMKLMFAYELYEEPPVVAITVDSLDVTMNEEAVTETELMNELERFYVEQFEGNVLRDFYETGELRSESEVKEGKRNGRYREFYPDGTLRARGKYVAGNPRGTWKYYTPEGKFERKNRF